MEWTQALCCHFTDLSDTEQSSEIPSDGRLLIRRGAVFQFFGSERRLLYPYAAADEGLVCQL